MYKIIATDGTVLYDGSNPDSYAVSQGHCTREIGQPGSLSFVMNDPEDQLYDSVAVMETYLYALDDNEEIFYGRIIDININPISGEKQIQCAGALGFLEDAEIAPFSNSSGQTMTATEFLTLCVNSYNAEISNDPKRAFAVGTIDHSKASVSKTYVISSYTQVKSALENNLLSEYGGYFRARRSNGTMYLDWLEDYDESNASPITMTQNIVSQENAITSNDPVTLIRPVGKNGITLPEGTIPIDNDLVTKFGRIVSSVSFNNAENTTDLRAKAEEYIARITGGLGKTCEVKVVDMHYLDGTVPKIRLCSTYTDLEGFDGEDMVAETIDQDFMDPSNDTVTFKNARELSASTRKGAAGVGKSTGRGNFTQNITNLYKHISETDDTLNLFADRININAVQIVQYAQEFDTFATATSGAIDRIEGTGVLQNSDHIVQAAGNFTRRYMRVSETKKAEVLAAGGNPHDYGWYIANDGYVVQESDINSGIELYDSINSALLGNSIPTATLVAGQTKVRMELTSDTEVDSSKTYYTRTLAVSTGTSVVIDENGQQVTVYDAIQENKEGIEGITGSAFWTQRDHITGIVGEFQIVHNSETGEEHLVVLTGGGMSIRKDEVEYGLYDSGNLTGGIIVEKLSDGVHTGTIDSQYYDDEYIENKVTIYGDIIKMDVKNAVIEETSTYIRTEVGRTASEIAYSVIEQTASYIHTEVSNAASSISASVIEQTASYIRTTVADVASEVAWSVIEQTMSGIMQEVGRKSKVYRQWTDPNDGTNHLNDGDMWIKVYDQRTWNELATMKWNKIAERSWNSYYGAVTYVWKGTNENGHWEKVVDKSEIKESKTWIEQSSEKYAILARQVDMLGNAFDSNLGVTAQKISTDVTAAKGELHSAIAQTATNITTRVENMRAGLQSSIEQTAQSITLSVSASKSELYSTIQQTATYIRMEVANAVSGLQSSIEQTASQIRTEVANTVSGIQSSITQNANKIALVVDAGNNIKAAQIVASINDGASSIIISADHINLDGYVKATDLTTDWLNGKIAQIATLTGIAARFSGNVAGSGGLFDAVYVKKSTNSYANISDPILEVQISGPTNNVYKLQYKSVTNTVWTDAGSFSRAISSWTWGGGSGYVNVTALPQSQTKSVKVSIDGTSSITANGTYTYNVDYENGDGDDLPTGASKTVTVNVPTTSRTDKGSNWSCSVTQLTSGGKKCTLTKEFAAGASVPFTNGTNYHLYT